MCLHALSSFLMIFGTLLGSFFQVANASAAQSFRISGTVVDALSGQPLGRAQVSIASAVPDATQVVTTADDGRFSFENLAAGHYRLSARRNRYVEQLYKQHEFFATAIVTGPNLNTDDLRFELRPGASISGQVFDERSEPVRGAQVLLFRQGLRSGERQTWRVREGNTDDRGHYRFSGLTPGSYIIGVVAQPWYAQHVARQRVQHLDPSLERMVEDEITTGNAALDVAYPATFFSNATDVTGATPISLHPGDAEVADVTLRPVPAVRLTFRTSSSEEPEQVSVQQISQRIADGVEHNLQVQMTQSAPGIIEVTGLPPGQLSLNWTSSKGDESTTHFQTVQLRSDVEINASDAPASPAVTGVIHMDDGSSLPGHARLFLHDGAARRSLSSQPQPNGEFTFEGQSIAPGTYDVGLSQSSGFVKSVSAVGGKVSGQTVELVAGQDVRLTVVVAKSAGAVTGLALKDGKPVDGVMVVLVPQDPEHNRELIRRDQSDSDGSFNLGGVLPGKYTVVAIENGWALEWLSPDVLRKYFAGGQPLQISATEKREVKVNVQQ
jgi:hypothetical protein